MPLIHRKVSDESFTIELSWLSRCQHADAPSGLTESILLLALSCITIILLLSPRDWSVYRGQSVVDNCLAINTVETILRLWKVTPKNYAVLLKFLRQPYTNNLIF